MKTTPEKYAAGDALLAVSARPGFGAEAAFEIDFRAAFEVLREGLGLFAPGGGFEEGGARLVFAGASVFDALILRQFDGADGRAAVGVVENRVVGQIAQDADFTE